MADLKRQPEAETEYRSHLKRSETVWDRWSNWYKMSEQDFEPIRNELLTQLNLGEGDDVLEIGCGPGVNFAKVHEAIGESGSLVAIDFSPEMIKKAQERVDRHGWGNIKVVRADATTAELGGPYDAAIATLALSIMPHVERTVQNVHSALKPDATLGVLDLQEFQSGPLRVFNPFLKWFLNWYANWNSEGNVRHSIDDVFGKTELLDTFMLGTVYTIKATRTAP